MLRSPGAVMEVQAQPGKRDQGLKNTFTMNAHNDNQNKALNIVAWHAVYLKGLAKSTLESFNISFDTSAVPLALSEPTVRSDFRYSISRGSKETDLP